jgi:hypothetical protein
VETVLDHLASPSIGGEGGFPPQPLDTLPLTALCCQPFPKEPQLNWDPASRACPLPSGHSQSPPRYEGPRPLPQSGHYRAPHGVTRGSHGDISAHSSPTHGFLSCSSMVLIKGVSAMPLHFGAASRKPGLGWERTGEVWPDSHRNQVTQPWPARRSPSRHW